MSQPEAPAIPSLAMECWDCCLHPFYENPALLLQVGGGDNLFSGPWILGYGSLLCQRVYTDFSFSGNIGRAQPPICRYVSKSIFFQVKDGGKYSKFTGALDELVPTLSLHGLCPALVSLELQRAHQ